MSPRIGRAGRERPLDAAVLPRSPRRSCPSSRRGARPTRASTPRTRRAACVQPGNSSSRTPSAPARSRKMSKSERASPGGSHGAVDLADAPLGVGVGAFLLAPDRRRQHQVRRARRSASDGSRPARPGTRAPRAPAAATPRLGNETIGLVAMIQSARMRLLERRLDDVGIGQAARGRNPIDRHVPERGQLLAIRRALELAVAGQARREAGLARAHRVALAGDRERRRARRGRCCR